METGGADEALLPHVGVTSTNGEADESWVPRGRPALEPRRVRRRAGVVLGVEVVVVVVAAWWFDWLFHNPACDVVFACGCTFNFLGGWDECNVHNTVGAPKCPWCIAPQSTAWLTSVLVRAVAIAAYFAYTRIRATWPRVSYLGCSPAAVGEIAAAAAVPALAWAVAVVVVAWAFFMAHTEYPYFLGFTRS